MIPTRYMLALVPKTISIELMFGCWHVRVGSGLVENPDPVPGRSTKIFRDLDEAEARARAIMAECCATPVTEDRLFDRTVARGR